MLLPTRGGRQRGAPAPRRGGETPPRCCHPQHGFVPAVAVSANADALGIDRVLLGDRIDASHDVAKVTPAEVLHVALGECLALAITASRVRAESEVAHGRLGTHDFCVPVRGTRRGRPAMHVDY